MEDDPLIEDEVDADDGDDDNQELLPSVDMSRVPSIFRQQIARVLADLRSRMSKKSPSNQHVYRSTGSADFPWKSEEHNWPAAFTLRRPVTFADALLPIWTTSFLCTRQSNAPQPAKWENALQVAWIRS
jgi:hypothetical protein